MHNGPGPGPVNVNGMQPLLMLSVTPVFDKSKFLCDRCIVFSDKASGVMGTCKPISHDKVGIPGGASMSLCAKYVCISLACLCDYYGLPMLRWVLFYL